MRSLIVAVAVGLLVPKDGTAQYPTDMLFCFNSGQLEACTDVGGGTLLDFDCPEKAWESFFGRVAWYPLRYIGPITIEVDARRTPSSRFPIYIEYLPLKDRPSDLGFCDGPGEVIAVVWGGTQCDSPWETFGPILLPLEVGELYFLRAHWVVDSTHHTYLNCIRVRAQTDRAPTAVESTMWGIMKNLYR
jgi:hypothetical protein